MRKFSKTELNESEFGSFVKRPIPVKAKQIDEEFEVETLEGTMRGKAGDYLMIGIRGEIYPCARDIFEESYEAV